MNELTPVYAIAGLIVAYFLVRVARRTFDPFEPVWLFLVGFLQVYVVQALSYHDWAVTIRGKELVAAANMRALWAFVWFLAVYHLGPGRAIAPVLPTPPRRWSTGAVAALAPIFMVWGLYCTGTVLGGGGLDPDAASAEVVLLRSFPFVLMVAAIMIIVTARSSTASWPGLYPFGLFVATSYIVLWMFNGKRSPGIIGVLSTVCACYVTRMKRPSWAVLGMTSFAGVMVVAIAINWRNTRDYESSVSGFTQYLSEFRIEKALASMNMESDDPLMDVSHETSEYGGFLLMMDTVPEKSEYDNGASYLRVFTTYIPRLVWPNKPYPGRDQWTAAWIAGSELKRDEEFTGPAIGILGATQLNGGAPATLLVLAAVALLLRTAYAYFLLHQDVPWVQFWWSITFFNAWFMVVADDPLTWFYYNWGISGFPVVTILWWVNRAGGPRGADAPAAVPGAILQGA